jgi:hypothetical protein
MTDPQPLPPSPRPLRSAWRDPGPGPGRPFLTKRLPSATISSTHRASGVQPMDHVLGLRCVLCGAEYGADEVRYVCPKHGDEGILDVVYDYDRWPPIRCGRSGATSRCCRCGR